MKRWTSIPLSLCMTLVFSQSGLVAKGGHGQGADMGRGQGTGPIYAQNSHGNGQGTVDRDLGKDRATEVGRGKTKELSKDHNRNSHTKDKDKAQTYHKDQK